VALVAQSCEHKIVSLDAYAFAVRLLIRVGWVASMLDVCAAI
jgi:hypothetical protein